MFIKATIKGTNNEIFVNERLVNVITPTGKDENSSTIMINGKEVEIIMGNMEIIKLTASF